ncbi:VWA domain-containing protein [Arenicella sp. 4NH20-0111]|uniref:vWA domain-containing protein n=1 Tax=Arenicella sp. 4NH20-0111 TaxID=3127648 RepID=UPI0031041449
MSTFFKRIMVAVVTSLALSFSVISAAKTVSVNAGLATPIMQANTEGTAFLRVALTGFELGDEVQRPPLNVALVLDQSSSMSGDKIERAKQAAIMAVSKLSARDVVSIVTYDSAVRVLVPATQVTDKSRLYNAIESIRANGSTALFAGTSIGADQVSRFLNKEKVNRVVLLSDGMANVGPDSPKELGDLGKALAKKGMSVSTIGLGLGYNEDLMTQLANYSDGNHDFVKDSADLARVFDREFGDAMSVVAQDVNIEIICDEGVIPIRVVGRESTIIGQRVTTRVNQLYSSQQNYVILEVQVPPAESNSERQIAAVNVVYNNMATQKSERKSDLVSVTFSNNNERVKGAIDKVAYESAVEQIANVETQRALELRDLGKVKEAKQTLDSNASYLDRAAKLISSPKLSRQSAESKAEADVVLEDEDWNESRKSIKAKTYKRSKQQERKD